MKIRGQFHIIAFLSVAIMMVNALAPSVTPAWTSSGGTDDNSPSDTVAVPRAGSPQSLLTFPRDSGGLVLAEHQTTGILDPVQIEQSGYVVSGDIGARTDSFLNLQYNHSIDEANNWTGSKAEVSIWNLQRQYAANGTFNEGSAGSNVNPNGSVTYHPLGWDANSTNSGTYPDELELASYDSTGSSYVVVENQGGKVGQNAFGHSENTSVVWTQVVQNAPYTEDFVLSFDYFYLRGPIDGPTGLDSVTGNCSIALLIDGSVVWNMSLLLLTQRGVWNSTGEIPINIPGAPSTFLFEIGLVIDETLVLDKRDDYDGDPLNLADGLSNSAYITTYLDDVQFTGSSAPSFDEVAFNFTAGSDKVLVSGAAGTGSASILNNSLWTASPLTVELETNVSVSFEYETRLLSHRFLNSSSTNDISQSGVHYSANDGLSPELELFTYVGTLGEYENFNVTITHPWDWDNATVFNPFLNDVSSQCEIGMDSIRLPESVLAVLGWWEVTLESPNYAKALTVQKYNSGSTSWLDDTVFRSGNVTRLSAEIGTATTIPTLSDPVNASWFMPNATQWSFEAISGGLDGVANSSARTLGATNASAGLWSVVATWVNGSEIAYDAESFSMYHSTRLTPVASLIETEYGQTKTGLLYFVDDDTNEFLMDGTTVMTGNWTSGPVTFDPDSQNNWWEGDFDTSLSGGGEFVVEVNASLPFYDDASCQFIVNVTYATLFDMPLAAALPQSLGLNESVEVNLSYKYGNGTGISSADIDVSYTGPENGLNISTWSENPVGNYTCDIQGKKKGTYSIIVSASKAYHDAGVDSFTLEVEQVSTDLFTFNGTQGTILYGEGYRISVQYNSSSGGVLGASFEVIGATPSIGFSWGSNVSEGEGFYSLVFSPTNISSFTVDMRVTRPDHQTQYTSFYLTVSRIQTELILNETSVTIGITDQYVISMRLINGSGGGVSGATISVVNPSPNLDFPDWQDLGDGNYTLTIDPIIFGTYTVNVQAEKQFHHIGLDYFTLVVEETPTEFILWNGTSDFIHYGDSYKLSVRYAALNGTGLSAAHVNVTDVNPATGLSFGDAFNEGAGNFSFVFTPTRTTTFTITIRANLTNHRTQFATFTLTVAEISTILSLNVSSSTISFEDTLAVRVTFTDHDGFGILGANISFIEADPSLSFENITDLNDGNYTFVVVPSLFGSYLIRIQANKTNYLNGFDSFSLVVAETGTELISLNGTAASIRFRENYTLAVYYGNVWGVGLVGAQIELLPIVGLDNESTIDYFDGNYSIQLTPLAAGAFTITIRASLQNHVTQIRVFTLTVRQIPTVLSLNDSTAEVAIDQSFILALYFSEEGGFGIEDASIDSLERPSELEITNLTDVGGGWYTLTVTPVQIGSHSFFIRASSVNYQNQTTSFTLLVTFIPTSLDSEGGVQEVTVRYMERFGLVLFYSRTDSNESVVDAVVEIESDPEVGLHFLVLENDGNITIEMWADSIGTWTLSIMLSKSDHDTSQFTFTFEVVAIETDIESTSSLGELTVTRSESLAFEYVIRSNNSRVQGASIVPQGPAANWVTWDETSEGDYSIAITPEQIGNFSVALVFSRDGFESQTIELDFEVVRIPLQIEVLHTLSGLEISLLLVQIRIIERGTDTTVSGALVRCTLYANDVAIESERFDEGENGIYETSIPLPEYSADTSLTLEIRVDLENYLLDDDSVFIVESRNDDIRDIMNVVVPSGSGLGLIVALVVAQRLYVRRKRELIIEALEVKRRFEDVQSMIGVVVLHKTSGLPLYSKILKGGFDESMISAFITAITQFQTEFGMQMEHDEFVVAQISDIIRAVPTMNLLCSFITVSRPSEALEKRMVVYARSVSFVFDSIFEQAPLQRLEQEKIDIFDAIFDDALDGALIRPHRTTIDDEFPKGLRCIQWMVPKVEGEDGSFNLEELAGSMADCGIEEGEVYRKIQEAIDKGLLETTEPVEPVDTSIFGDVDSEGEPEA